MPYEEVKRLWAPNRRQRPNGKPPVGEAGFSDRSEYTGSVAEKFGEGFWPEITIQVSEAVGRVCRSRFGDADREKITSAQ
jgi:hypothetical protein